MVYLVQKGWWCDSSYHFESLHARVYKDGLLKFHRLALITRSLQPLCHHLSVRPGLLSSARLPASLCLGPPA